MTRLAEGCDEHSWERRFRDVRALPKNAPGCLQHLCVIPLGMTTAADSQKFASLREHEERRIGETTRLRAANDRMIAYLMNISVAICLGYAFRGDPSMLSGLEISALLAMLLAGAVPSAVFFFTERPREDVGLTKGHLKMEQREIEMARYFASSAQLEASEKNLKLARRWRRRCLVIWGVAMIAAILLVAINAAIN